MQIADGLKKVLNMLALVTDAFGGKGGIAQYNRDFLSAVALSGSFGSIKVLPRAADQAGPIPNLITQIQPRPRRIPYVWAAIKTVFQRVDVVFCGHLYMAALSLVMARLHRAKLVIQLHGIEAWNRPSPLLRAAVEASDLVLCVSRFTRQRVLSWASIAPERVLVVPNTVRECFQPGDSSGFLESYGLVGKRVLLTVGRMASSERYKGHDRVIQEIPKLVASRHDVVYVVIGDGNDTERLKLLTRTIGVEDRVIFIGTAEAGSLVQAYRASDLFVMASTGEGFGIVFVEAMACGTRALGLDVAGARDALGDGQLGFMVSAGRFGDCLREALIDRNPNGPELAAAVRRRFGRETFQNQVWAVLDRLENAA